MRSNAKNRNYSIIVVSDATSSSKEFLVSSKLIRNTMIGAALMLPG